MTIATNYVVMSDELYQAIADQKRAESALDRWTALASRSDLTIHEHAEVAKKLAWLWQAYRQAECTVAQLSDVWTATRDANGLNAGRTR